MGTSLYQLLKSENSISSSHNNYISIYLNLIIIFLFKLTMVYLSSAENGDITTRGGNRLRSHNRLSVS